MAHSYIDFGSQNILVRDELIYWLMASVIDESRSKTISPQLQSLLTWWEDNWNKFGPGCIELSLDKFVRDSKPLKELIQILDSIALKTETAGSTITGAEIENVVKSSRFAFGDQSTATLCEVVVRVKGLLLSRV